MKTLAIFALGAVLISGCGRENSGQEDPLRTKPGLQPGEVYDSGGSSLTNPIATNQLDHPTESSSQQQGGAIRK